jgi:TRAP-type C4-dicarboxylate transport system permease small subunit
VSADRTLARADPPRDSPQRDSPPREQARSGAGGLMHRLVAVFDRVLAVLAGLAMIGAFVAVALGVVARMAGWDIPGLDAYAGYAIAAALFLALPQTLRRQEHIRVTLVLDRCGPRLRAALEWWSLAAGLMLATYLAYYAVRLVIVSRAMHDVSQGADATPLWLPQIAMALGCIGFALSMLDALVSRWRGRTYFQRFGDAAARAE